LETGHGASPIKKIGKNIYLAILTTTYERPEQPEKGREEPEKKA
jgi:hypothetical protein